MTNQLNISRIWWRYVQPGEFYNIERHPKRKGGNGSLYIEIPEAMVSATLDFLDLAATGVESLPVTIQARVIGQASISGPIEFHPKSDGRMRIARQNRQQPNAPRHPAWTSDRGFPSAPDDVRTTDDARPYYPNGGLRIYIAKTIEGDYYAGFKAGPRPSSMNPNDPLWDLYANTTGGVIEAE